VGRGGERLYRGLEGKGDRGRVIIYSIVVHYYNWLTGSVRDKCGRMEADDYYRLTKIHLVRSAHFALSASDPAKPAAPAAPKLRE
jgi:hypothetical protein